MRIAVSIAMLTLSLSSSVQAGLLLGDTAPKRSWRLVAEAEGYDIIKTRSGTVYTGTIVRENEIGILLRTTNGESVLVKYADVADVQSTRRRADAPTAAPVAPAPVAPAPSAMAPAPSHAYEISLLNSRISELEKQASGKTTGLVLGSIGGLVTGVVGFVVMAMGYTLEGICLLAASVLIVGGNLLQIPAVGELRSQIQELKNQRDMLRGERSPVPIGGIRFAFR